MGSSEAQGWVSDQTGGNQTSDHQGLEIGYAGEVANGPSPAPELLEPVKKVFYTWVMATTTGSLYTLHFDQLIYMKFMQTDIESDSLNHV